MFMRALGGGGHVAVDKLARKPRIGRSRTSRRTAQSREIIKHINDHKSGLKELNAFNAGDCRSVALVPVTEKKIKKLETASRK